MRQRFLILLACAAFYSFTGSGQTYLVPNVGVTLAGTKQNLFDETGFRIGYRVGVDIQRYISRLQLGVGLSYFISGYSIPGPNTVSDTHGTPLGTTDKAIVLQYQHIGLPVTFGYKAVSKRVFSFTPTVGLEPTYNLGGRQRVFNNLNIGVNSNFDDMLTLKKIENFDDSYKRFSLLASVQLKFGFMIRERFGLFVAPSFRYMILGFTNDGQGIFQFKQHNYLIGADAGVYIKM